MSSNKETDTPTDYGTLIDPKHYPSFSKEIYEAYSNPDPKESLSKAMEERNRSKKEHTDEDYEDVIQRLKTSKKDKEAYQKISKFLEKYEERNKKRKTPSQVFNMTQKVSDNRGKTISAGKRRRKHKTRKYKRSKKSRKH